ncbi:MAG: phospho-N-acetylmuramoyl-pentapeptide-transferase [Flavobacteriales bacterium]|nr:phospho-N-acetylmuramoyl-pentapeptide-transferase [Flavobacteriales bacterium]|tara:strand:- start:4479 stop:5729 length:1251 start_codon:yes stop_codon:yes gene_type:complete
MLHYIFDYLNNTGINSNFHNLFNYISFRSALAILTSLFVTIYFGKIIITFLSSRLVKDNIRDLGLQGQLEKKDTPTMGGVIILIGILIPTILLCRLNNIYIMIMIFTTIWMGLIGFLDDYIKVFQKNKDGLAAKFKLVGQVFLGFVVALIMFFHPQITIKERIQQPIIENVAPSDNTSEQLSEYQFTSAKKSLKTTIPFLKNNQLDYGDILKIFKNQFFVFIFFAFIVVFIITGVSNSANLTDGIDGLATGTSAIIGATLGIFCYLSGNLVFSEYLNIMYIPNTGELVVFIASFVGACVGFLWYNSFPAQVFMGDTGSLALGGIIGVVAILIRKELLLPIFCGVFFIESLSVIIQVSYYKYTKKQSDIGKGKRIFLMSPLHHHFQKKGIHESKIVTRFWIVCVFLCLLAFVTLKLR